MCATWIIALAFGHEAGPRAWGVGAGTCRRSAHTRRRAATCGGGIELSSLRRCRSADRRRCTSARFTGWTCGSDGSLALLHAHVPFEGGFGASARTAARAGANCGCGGAGCRSGAGAGAATGIRLGACRRRRPRQPPPGRAARRRALRVALLEKEQDLRGDFRFDRIVSLALLEKQVFAAGKGIC
jgi:hypothetical protein